MQPVGVLLLYAYNKNVKICIMNDVHVSAFLLNTYHDFVKKIYYAYIQTLKYINHFPGKLSYMSL